MNDYQQHMKVGARARNVSFALQHSLFQGEAAQGIRLFQRITTRPCLSKWRSGGSEGSQLPAEPEIPTALSWRIAFSIHGLKTMPENSVAG